MNEARMLNALPTPRMAAGGEDHHKAAHPVDLRGKYGLMRRSDFWLTIATVGVVAAAFAACVR